MYDFLANVDAIIAVNLLYLINGYDVGAVYAQELICGQHRLDCFHREVGDEGLAFSIEIEHDIILHSAYVGDAVDSDITQFAIHADEETLRLVVFISGLTLIPLLRLLNCREELVIAYRFQQEIEGRHLVTLESVFLECRGEDDTGVGGNHVCQLHTVEVGHLNVEEKQVGLLLFDGIDSLDGIRERA